MADSAGKRTASRKNKEEKGSGLVCAASFSRASVLSPGVPAANSSPLTTNFKKNAEILNQGSTNSVVDNQSFNSFDMEAAFRGLATAFRQPQLPTVEPEVFLGDPMVFPRWEAQLAELIDTTDASGFTKLRMLSRYVGGRAADCIKALLAVPSPNCYERARENLKRRFGNPLLISEAFREQLSSWAPISDKDGEGLRAYTDFLEQMEASMSYLPSLQILNDSVENSRMVMKLPSSVASRWARIVAKSRAGGEYPQFVQFVAFLQEEVDIACDPLTLALTAKTAKVAPHVVHRASAQPSNDRAPAACVKCRSPSHTTRECPVLCKAGPIEAKEFVFSERLCFRCLHRGHQSRDCAFKPKCAKCTGPHPTALHSSPKRQTTSAVCHDVI